MKLDKSACSATSSPVVGQERDSHRPRWKDWWFSSASWRAPCTHLGLFLCGLTEGTVSHSANCTRTAGQFRIPSLLSVQNGSRTQPAGRPALKATRKGADELSNSAWKLTGLNSPSASAGEVAAATAASWFSLLLCFISHAFSVVFTGVPWAFGTAIRDVSQTTGCHLGC